MKILLFVLLFPILCFSQFEGNKTPTYKQLLHFYDSLRNIGQVELYNMGDSDYGLPIYLCVLNGKGDSISTFKGFQSSHNIFVNNAIHAGEPDGINACALFTLDYLSKKFKIDSKFTFSFFLAYNVGGMMNRSTNSRANQNGPEEYGFRASAKNLDLNRDFVKMDSENSFVFAKTFHLIKPILFIDTHVSNGADYTYILTLIHSLKQRQTKAINTFTHTNFLPYVEKNLKEKQQIDCFPYVELKGETPDEGIVAFNDLPRYASGYCSLFPCISITTETHMLKPFPKRVQATLHFLKEATSCVQNYSKDLELSIIESKKEFFKEKRFYHTFKLQEKKDSIYFKGYQHEFKKSSVTQLPFLSYDASKNHFRYIPYYTSYKAMDSVLIPKYYIVSLQCKEVIKRLKANDVQFISLKSDSIIKVNSYNVLNSVAINKAYEGHFYYKQVEIEEITEKQNFKNGDLIIKVNENNYRFLCSVLEPKAEDSYFRWNFFDSYLQQKEYFSDYVFEAKAKEILDNDKELKKIFEEKRQSDNNFATNHWEQLYFIYKNSEFFEPSFMKLPIYKIVD
ncbi:MAG: hypothetical protein HYU67_10540 [Flavobacteriia bacterium]|nr:hypothetical protein [Flavobacteriia bacterium]